MPGCLASISSKTMREPLLEDVFIRNQQSA